MLCDGNFLPDCLNPCLNGREKDIWRDNQFNFLFLELYFFHFFKISWGIILH